MNDGHAFSHDPRRCIKCHSCEIACKQWKNIAAGTYKLRVVSEIVTGTFPNVVRTFRSVACQHCPDAPCIASCPPGAISRSSLYGIIMIDAANCDGCRACQDACPLSAVAFDQTGSAQLCDLCVDRLAEGKQPVCTDACSTGALRCARTESG